MNIATRTNPAWRISAGHEALRAAAACSAVLICVGAGPAAADVIELATGETLDGTIVHRDQHQIIFRHPILGELTLAPEHVARIEVGEAGGESESRKEQASAEGDRASSAPAADGQASPDAEHVSATLPDAGAEASTSVPPSVSSPLEGTLSPWRTTFEFGLNGSHGNTETIDGRIAMLLTRETDAVRTGIDAAYYYGESRGDRSTNRLTAGTRNDWKLPDSPLFYFVEGRFDFDEFQSWDYRYGAGGGMGYELLDSEAFRLIGRAGLGASEEVGGPFDDGLDPEAILGLDLAWRINEQQSLQAASTWYPEIDDAEDSRLTLSADWLFHLDHARGIDFKLGVFDEYRSMTDPGILHNDFKFYGALVFNF